MHSTKKGLGDNFLVARLYADTKHLKDTDGLYIFTVGYVPWSVFLSIARSYIKAALSFFSTLLPLEDSKRLF
jgi:hypothetical protein